MNSDQIMTPKMATGFRKIAVKPEHESHSDSVGTGRER